MTGPPASGPLVAWYGDDFTGAAAVMEVLEFSGFPSVLFLGLPDPALRARFADRRCTGIAGDARTRPPEWMDQNLPPVFAALRETGAPVIHYKVCSTFDSAPDIGSIGRAAELGIGDWAPLVVAAPRIGRWQVFGTLFARHPGGIARLDRHPTMAVHPVTPMTEADVARHLARQTALPVGLVSILDLQAGRAAETLARVRGAGARIVAFDLLDDASLRETGALIWAEAQVRQLFVLGSQGIEDTRIAACGAAGHQLPVARPAPPSGPIAVVSGSCSPDTARQIAVAEAQGFAAIPIDATRTPDTRAWAQACAAAEAAALAALARGQSVIVHSARGPDDPAIAAARAAREAAGQSPRDGAETLGRGLGALLGRLAARAGLARTAIAGGDTSGFAIAERGIAALTAEAEIVPAVPLLHAHFADPARPPAEIAVKGGQMGPENLFALVRDGPAGAAACGVKDHGERRSATQGRTS